MRVDSYTIITGPAGRSGALKTPSEIRAQLQRQEAKRDDAHRLAVDESIHVKAQEALKILAPRTTDGLDYQRKPFGAYSTKYADWKGVRETDVDLKLTGGMLGSLSVSKIGDGHYRLRFGEAYHTRLQQLASGRWKSSRGTQVSRPKRRAMGFDNIEDRKALSLKALRAYQRVFRREMKSTV